jgi:hypothetical protein
MASYLLTGKRLSTRSMYTFYVCFFVRTWTGNTRQKARRSEPWQDFSGCLVCVDARTLCTRCIHLYGPDMR